MSFFNSMSSSISSALSAAVFEINESNNAEKELRKNY